MATRPNPIPENYRSAIPMLAVRNAASAISFYQEVFGATEVMRMVDANGHIAHAEIKIGDAQIMIADPAPGENVTPDALGGTPVIIHLFVEDVDALFSRAVQAGAKVMRPLANQFTGNRNGKLQDPFGHVWLIQTHQEDVGPEEMKERFARLVAPPGPA